MMKLKLTKEQSDDMVITKRDILDEVEANFSDSFDDHEPTSRAPRIEITRYPPTVLAITWYWVGVLSGIALMYFLG